MAISKKMELDAMLLAAPYLEIIQEKMIEDNLNRKELAEKIGTSPSYITQLLNTNKMLIFSVLARIAEILELDFQVSRKSDWTKGVDLEVKSNKKFQLQVLFIRS